MRSSAVFLTVSLALGASAAPLRRAVGSALAARGSGVQFINGVATKVDFDDSQAEALGLGPTLQLPPDLVDFSHLGGPFSPVVSRGTGVEFINGVATKVDFDDSQADVVSQRQSRYFLEPSQQMLWD
ncbi:hypothetical protein BV25DRAFT_1819982 [Artomyces pyxidatus]|uniref:Uncharacterized protein n=1 Tax=Artomyces pyxidatus TaxID=48021 RepID=A0ACB8TEM9_9AGAM|nr:hypothetical protein BV25DRAFT_1819982 [Artomyces pyxidatus]